MESSSCVCGKRHSNYLDKLNLLRDITVKPQIAYHVHVAGALLARWSCLLSN